MYCLQKRCDASQAEDISWSGHRIALGGGRDDSEPSAAAPWLDLVCQEEKRVFYERRSLRLSNQSFTFGFLLRPRLELL